MLLHLREVRTCIPRPLCTLMLLKTLSHCALPRYICPPKVQQLGLNNIIFLLSYLFLTHILMHPLTAFFTVCTSTNCSVVCIHTNQCGSIDVFVQVYCIYLTNDINLSIDRCKTPLLIILICISHFDCTEILALKKKLKEAGES